MPDRTINTELGATNRAFDKLVRTCTGVPTRTKLALAGDFDGFSKQEKQALKRILNAIGVDSFDAAFNFIHSQKLDVSVEVLRFLRSTLRDNSLLMPIERTERKTEKNGCFFEEGSSADGQTRVTIGIVGSNRVLVSGTFLGDQLQAASMNLLGYRLVSLSSHRPLWVTAKEIEILHGPEAYVASSVALADSIGTNFGILVRFLKCVQCVTVPRFANIVTDPRLRPYLFGDPPHTKVLKPTGSTKFKNPNTLARMDNAPGKALLYIPQAEQECTSSNGCTDWPDLNYKTCCDEHDKCYCRGGTESDRGNCDWNLYKCVSKYMGSAYAYLMYVGVQAWGVSHFNYHSSPEVQPGTPNASRKTQVRIWLDTIQYTGTDIGNDTVMRIKFTVLPKDGNSETASHKETDLGHNKQRSVNQLIYDKVFSNEDPLLGINVWARVVEEDLGCDDSDTSAKEYRRSDESIPLYPTNAIADQIFVRVYEASELGTALFTFSYRFRFDTV